jgi:hypothetical protein
MGLKIYSHLLLGLFRRGERLPGHQQLLRDSTNPPIEEARIVGGYKTAMSWQQFRRPFLSAEGYVGLAPDHAEVSDLVVILIGAKFPYILRQNGDDVFTFISEAYVHGIMYGEFLEKKGHQIEDFVLC